MHATTSPSASGNHRASLRRAGALLGALALAVGATALHIVAEWRLDFRSIFSFFYVAVLISALRWGLASGVITAIASAVFGSIFVQQPRGTLPWGDPVEETELLLFMIVAALMLALVEGLRRARTRADQAAADAALAAEQLRQEMAVRRQAEEDLARQRDHLEEMVRERTEALEASHQRVRVSERMAAVGAMAAGLAHDLGNLIMPMQAHLDSLKARPLPADAREEAGAIARCVDYLASLANGLRLFARDPLTAEPDEVTRPGQWLRDAAPFFRNVLPAYIELKIDVPADLPDLRVAPHRLTQAVINLIGNAKDAIGAAPGSVTLRARQDADDAADGGRGGRHVLIEVIDDGPGMTEEVQRRCMEPYFTTRRGAGTGLGLALVREIASSAGGAVSIESAPGRGARVSLTLPVAYPMAAGRTAAVTVDDRRLDALARAIIERTGFRHLGAGDDPDAAAAESAEAAADEPPDADLWVVDAAAAETESLMRFLGARPGRVVIAWGQPPPALAGDGVIAVEQQTASALRDCLERLASEWVAQPAAPLRAE